jgi:magnesium-transporting ATPase (P-type)
LREEVDCDGEAWTALEVVLLKCNVFARMSPHNKQELMRSLQDLDYVVCMTGDGANDSGALKAADIGISIASAKNVLLVEPGAGGKKEEGAVGGGGGAGGGEGEEDEDEERQDDDNPENAKIATEISTAEAAVTAAPSIAAPFATGLHHIGAVCTVVTEGRGTLATSFSMFKYMFLYGIIQVR